MNILYIIIALITGIFVGYILFLAFTKPKLIERNSYDDLSRKYLLSEAEVKSQTETAHHLFGQIRQLEDRLSKTESAYNTSCTEIATSRANLENGEKRAIDLNKTITAQQLEISSQQNTINTQAQKVAELTASLDGTRLQLAASHDLSDKLTAQIEQHQQLIAQLRDDRTHLSAENNSLNEKLSTQKEDLKKLQETAQLHFETLATKIFEEKSSRFTETNKVNMESLLNPLKEDITKFKTKVEETYDKESKERFSLENKVKELIEQTNKVSNEANNLATALKGQTKKQGNWGEMILERILETSGLSKDREYFVQATIKDEDGRSLRPDVLVHLPDNRAVIIDSKVSLVAYDRYMSAETPEEQQAHLAEHINSINGHIDNLHSKKYDNLENALDFTMMFIPIEPAYLVSIQSDQDLWARAYAKRILLISPTNLIACLKLISDLWNREKQSRNAQEIVQRGERLFEKIVGFTHSMEEIGKALNKAQGAYSTAFDQLKNGRGSMMNQAQHLKDLGLKSSKKLPGSLLPIDVELPDESAE